VPYDPEAGKASLFGQVLVHTSPEAPAALAYQEAVGELQLGRDVGKVAARPIETTLSLAAAAVLENPPPPRTPPAPNKRKSSTRVARLRVPAPVSPSLRNDPLIPQEREPAREGPHRPVPLVPRAPHVALEESESHDEPAVPPLHSTQSPALVWVGSAIVAGVGLRFVQLPDFALPMIVGMAVAAGVTLVLHLLTQANAQEKDLAASAPTSASESHQGHRSTNNRHPGHRS
jgi:hypothetical protein